MRLIIAVIVKEWPLHETPIAEPSMPTSRQSLGTGLSGVRTITIVHEQLIRFDIL